jgi:hypothetical protein
MVVMMPGMRSAGCMCMGSRGFAGAVSRKPAYPANDDGKRQ